MISRYGGGEAEKRGFPDYPAGFPGIALTIL